MDRDPDLLAALERLVDPAARGDPQSPLRWTCKSLKQLARELGEQGHRISHVSVGILLKELGYSLQGNRKTLEGTDHPDRDVQFQYIQEKTQQALDAGQPVIAVDTKKKELVGNYKMPVRSGGRRENRRRFRCMTSWMQNWGGLIPTGFTILPRTRDG